MIALYKIWNNKVEKTKWGLNVTYYDQIIENIREILLKMFCYKNALGIISLKKLLISLLLYYYYF